ncbi:unnamed protein product [Arctia plantaginis]|uniref:Uncharacterized protein n=1 Tax=Arctia plantaginis TaxID=874455 RepID=A0A8S0ZIK9_ARCPL|nr:unnamed protein product [Arctia plantaginis]
MLTQFCVTAFQKNDEDNVVTNLNSRQLSPNYPEENPSHLNLSHEDKYRTRDDYSKNSGVVKFEDDFPTKLPNESHFFPIDADSPGNEETHGGDGNLKKYTRVKPFYNDEQSYDNDEEKRVDEREINEYRDTMNSGTESNAGGRVIFEDNNKTEKKEPVRKKKRKSSRKQRVSPLLDNNVPISSTVPFNHPGNRYLGKQPGSSLYKPGYGGSFQGYGLYPGYQAIGPSRPLKNPVNPSQNDQTDQLNTKYTAQYPVGASGGQASSVFPGYLQNTGYPGNGQYSLHAYPNSQYGQYIHNPGYPGYAGPQQRRPKSLTQQAVSAVAEALTSIALFDDKQCVPRILCEVASGSSAGSPTLLKATAGLGPLLSILQSYNSVSSSPLFLFGRAAVLGMTSTGNTISCHRAYPQCPRDPTELVNYLNNHNGGFFRFFGQPGPQKQQNLEQFYNHLAGQTGQQQTQQQNYANTYGYGNQNPYGNSNDPNNYRRIDNRGYISLKETDDVQERIQNKPSIDIDDEDNTEDGSKWTFPDEANDKRRRPRKQIFTTNTAEREAFGERGGYPLKFPDERGPTDDTERDKRRDFIRTHKVKFFPNQNDLNFETNTAVNNINLQEYEFDYKHNFYVKRPEQITNFLNDGAQIVYIVRGHGDPNHPEIVRVKPGQSALNT